MVVCALVLAFVDVEQTVALARLPDELRVARPSLAFPLAALPIDPTATRVAGSLLLGGCALGLVGFQTRLALTVGTLAGLYVLGISQHVGAVVHHHHLVWFLAALAASPSADVLSIDAARRAAAGAPRPPRRSLRYGVPVWTARVLIGLIFFFPGVHKLLEAGWGWIWSDNLRNQMYFKWLEHRQVSFRIDHYPLALRGLAFVAVAFELSALWLLPWRRARPVVALAAFGFHMFTELFMFIRFTVLWPSYVVLLDSHDALRGLAAEVYRRKLVVRAPRATLAVLRSADPFGRVVYRPSDERAPTPWPALLLRHPLAPLSLLAARWPSPARRPQPSPRLALAVGAILIAANVAFGIAGTTQAWPFACYPTFEWPAGELIPHLTAEAVRADGTTVALDMWPRTQKEWGVVWSAIGATHGPFEPSRLRGYWRSSLRARREAAHAGAVRVRLYRSQSSVVPERWSDPPVRRLLLLELDLGDDELPSGSRER